MNNFQLNQDLDKIRTEIDMVRNKVERLEYILNERFNDIFNRIDNLELIVRDTLHKNNLI